MHDGKPIVGRQFVIDILCYLLVVIHHEYPDVLRWLFSLSLCLCVNLACGFYLFGFQVVVS